MRNQSSIVAEIRAERIEKLEEEKKELQVILGYLVKDLGNEYSRMSILYLSALLGVEKEAMGKLFRDGVESFYRKTIEHVGKPTETL